MSVESESATADAPEPSSAQSTLLVARPIVWLDVAAVGFVLAGVGVAIDAYRHDHGAAAAELISRSNPGFLVALGGLSLAAVALLVALTLLALHGAETATDVIRRGAGVAIAWTAVAAAAVAALTYVTTSGIIVGHSGHTAAGAVPATAVTLRGTLTVDGAPLTGTPLGARVMRDGLAGACQTGIATVESGRYEITVRGDAAASGCGAPGAEIVLWTFVAGGFAYTSQTMPWPDTATSALTFDATFSTASRDGASQPATEIAAQIKHRDGSGFPRGTVVEAFIGDKRCGIASVGMLDNPPYALLIVAGPQVAGCAKNGSITFRIDGNRSSETVANDLQGGDDHKVDLTFD